MTVRFVRVREQWELTLHVQLHDRVGHDGDVETWIGVLGVAHPLHAGAEGGAGGHRLLWRHRRRVSHWGSPTRRNSAQCVISVVHDGLSCRHQWRRDLPGMGTCSSERGRRSGIAPGDAAVVGRRSQGELDGGLDGAHPTHHAMAAKAVSIRLFRF
jgi:hypothetical protein